ncbi:MAG: ferritin-like domain-containing protein [Phycisphaerales bacterium]
MLETLRDLLEDQIKDLYSAENQLLKALPKMARKASSDALREAFESHLEETNTHVERINEIAELLDMRPGGKSCKAMQGLIEEGKEVLEEDGNDTVIDAALIIAAQRVEHYEISAYGSARALAEQLGEAQVVALLEETLDEEKSADVKLSDISTDEILPSAPQDEGDESDEEETDQRARKPKVVTRSNSRSTAKPGAKRSSR